MLPSLELWQALHHANQRLQLREIHCNGYTLGIKGTAVSLIVYALSWGHDTWTQYSQHAVLPDCLTVQKSFPLVAPFLTVNIQPWGIDTMHRVLPY